MVKSDANLILPTSEQLLDSDDFPVDNELQTLVPNFLRFMLNFIWGDRFDWFMGINMGIYHTTGINPRVPVVPDGFLTVGVERIKGDRLRKSYVVWEEGDRVPQFVLEVVSQTPGGEYDEKMEIYCQLGILYYVIYNPDYWLRDRHEPLEIYRLTEGSYQRQIGEPFFMPEIGLGIGRGVGIHDRLEREWLYWYNQQGQRFLSPEELAIEAENRNQKLIEKLKELGINPDSL